MRAVFILFLSLFAPMIAAAGSHLLPPAPKQDSTDPIVEGGREKPVHGELLIGGKPFGAKVVLSGNRSFVRNIKLRSSAQTIKGLEVGRYGWSAKAPGYDDARGELVISVDSTSKMKINLVRLGSILIHGNQRRLGIEIKGPNSFAANFELPAKGHELKGLPTGTYTWAAWKRGHQKQEGTLRVIPGVTQKLSVGLKKLGALLITGQPAGAAVHRKCSTGRIGSVTAGKYTG